MTNAEWVSETGKSFCDISVMPDEKGYLDIFWKHEIIGYWEDIDEMQALKEWLDEEHTEPLLNTKEKEYLGTLIGPWDVRYIVREKLPGVGDKEVLKIVSGGRFETVLPPFLAETRFTGLDLNERYTPEELGL